MLPSLDMAVNRRSLLTGASTAAALAALARCWCWWRPPWYPAPMAMSASARQQDRIEQEGTPPLSDPRCLSLVQPPPMLLIPKGWWSDRTTRRQAAELEQKDLGACWG